MVTVATVAEYELAMQLLQNLRINLQNMIYLITLNLSVTKNTVFHLQKIKPLRNLGVF